MVIALLAMALATAAPAPTRCDALVSTTRALVVARQHGVTERQARDTVDQELEGDARQVVTALLWYVYVANADGRTSTRKTLQLVRHACTSSERNALSVAP